MFLAQFPVSLDIRKNVDTILAMLEHVQEDQLVILPEGAVSGYTEDPAFLRDELSAWETSQAFLVR